LFECWEQGGSARLRAVKGALANRRGQTIAELAIVLPVLIMILAGMMDFGRVLNEYIVVTAAAREGARAAAVSEDGSAAIAAATAAAASINTPDNPVTVTVDPAAAAAGQPVTVTVSHSVSIIFPLIQAMLGASSYTVQGQSVMRVE